MHGELPSLLKFKLEIVYLSCRGGKDTILGAEYDASGLQFILLDKLQ